MSASTTVLVVMGVSASGKSTIGKALAERLGCPFEDGDDLHPPANIAKMRSGHPLDDADRAPWLDRVADWIGRQYHSGEGGVISCSALKRRYRDRLRQADPQLAFVFPDPDRETLCSRLKQRKHHFMPPSMLDSQLDTLERPAADECALRLSGTSSIADQVDAVCEWLAR